MSRFLSVVIPAYNEEARLPPTLERVAAFLREQYEQATEVVVVNDGSKDGTVGVVREASTRLGDDQVAIRLVENPGNRGKGYSVRHGMLEAEGDWRLFSDADLSAPIEELPKLFAAVNGDSHDGAIGSRAVDRSLVGTHQPLFREFSGRLFNLFVRVGAGLSYADTQCGFKLFSRSCAEAVFPKQQLERFGFDVELLYLAKKLGFSIVETPVVWNDVEGTKVRMLDGADAFLDVARVRWNDIRGKYR